MSRCGRLSWQRMQRTMSFLGWPPELQHPRLQPSAVASCRENLRYAISFNYMELLWKLNWSSLSDINQVLTKSTVDRQFYEMDYTNRSLCSEIKTFLQEVKQRQQICLELLGERNEHIEELEDDVADMKIIFRSQISLAADQLITMRQQNHSHLACLHDWIQDPEVITRKF